MTTVFTVGASLTDNNTPGEEGYGDLLQQFLPQGYDVHNRGLSGRSSKSYVDGGHWATTLALIEPGDIVTIEFGVNDQSADVNRMTDPGTGPDYVGTFRDYMELMINEAKLAGAHVILLTPTPRFAWANGTQVFTHGEFPAAIVEIAIDNFVDLIDLERLVFDFLSQFSEAYVRYCFVFDDNSHTNERGAREIAKILASALNL